MEAKPKLFLVSVVNEVVKSFETIDDLKTYLDARRSNWLDSFDEGNDWFLISGEEWALDESLLWARPPGKEPISLLGDTGPKWRKKLTEDVEQ